MISFLDLFRPCRHTFSPTAARASHHSNMSYSLLGLLLSGLGNSSVDVRALRAFRVLRPLRLVTSLQSATFTCTSLSQVPPRPASSPSPDTPPLPCTGLRIVLNSILLSIPTLNQVAMLLLFLISASAIGEEERCETAQRSSFSKAITHMQPSSTAQCPSPAIFAIIGLDFYKGRLDYQCFVPAEGEWESYHVCPVPLPQTIKFSGAETPPYHSHFAALIFPPVSSMQEWGTTRQGTSSIMGHSTR